MNEIDARQAHAPRWICPKPLLILAGCLVTVVVIPVVLDLLSSMRKPSSTSPLDQCVTEERVLEYLDGKQVFELGPLDGPGMKSVTLHRERISSLEMRADGDSSKVLLRFNVDHAGQRYTVEGDFWAGHSDSPELHYASWGPFTGRVVSRR
jgi:hypothetical protein